MTVDTNPSGSSAPADGVTVFHYDKPVVAGKKETLRLSKTSYGVLKVQVMNYGGENNLHSHPRLDGFWFVLKGRVRFYTTDDVVVAELGENEGFSTPRGYRYWFEADPSAGDLELFQFHASTVDLTEAGPAPLRINHSERKPNQVNLLRHEAEQELANQQAEQAS